MVRFEERRCFAYADFGENLCGYDAALWNCRFVLRGYATKGFRQGHAIRTHHRLLL